MSIGAGDYQVVVAGELRQFSNWRDIPDDFEHIVKFLPEIPPGPHTQEEHDEIDRLPGIFQQFMEKERARSNPRR